MNDHRRHKIFFVSSVLYLAGISGLMLRHNIWFSPDQFFIFAMVAAIFLGRGRKFIRDWTPLMLFFFSYEFFRGALPAIAHFPLHSADLIQVEKNIFGAIPTIELQRIFFQPGNLHWYDLILSLTYMTFWICPLIFAYFLWVKNLSIFRFLSIAFFVLTYMAFITFVFFPAMPPWMAAEKGLLPAVHRILFDATGKLTVPGSLPTFYSLFRSNETAAMPSLHAAIPTLLVIIALMTKNRLLLILSAGYALLTYISVVYLGEHYAIDVFAGVLYAVAAYFIAVFLARKWRLAEG